MLPDQIKKFIDVFSELPSIGPRQATRLAFHIIGLGKSKISEFTNSFVGLENLKNCAECFFPHQNSNNLCNICLNTNRRNDIIAIVEKETDLLSIEKAKKFNGKYLVVGDLKKGGLLDQVQKIKLQSLKARLLKLPNGVAEEIIVATNPTTYGDLGASAISQEMRGAAKKMTRLGRGIPTGGEIEFADEETLSQSLDNRN